MDKYSLEALDCVWAKCKNLQKINSIETFFYVNTDGLFSIDYCFHKIDFEMWKKMIEYHKHETDGVLYDNLNNKIDVEKIINSRQYYQFTMKSKNPNLYRNINLIFFLDDLRNWNNMDEMIRLNTWEQ